MDMQTIQEDPESVASVASPIVVSLPRPSRRGSGPHPLMQYMYTTLNEHEHQQYVPLHDSIDDTRQPPQHVVHPTPAEMVTRFTPASTPPQSARSSLSSSSGVSSASQQSNSIWGQRLNHELEEEANKRAIDKFLGYVRTSRLANVKPFAWKDWFRCQPKPGMATFSNIGVASCVFTAGFCLLSLVAASCSICLAGLNLNILTAYDIAMRQASSTPPTTSSEFVFYLDPQRLAALTILAMVSAVLLWIASFAFLFDSVVATKKAMHIIQQHTDRAEEPTWTNIELKTRTGRRMTSSVDFYVYDHHTSSFLPVPSKELRDVTNDEQNQQQSALTMSIFN